MTDEKKDTPIDPAAAPIITGQYEVAMQLTQNRQLKISGYVYLNETNESVNNRIDAAQDAMDRQFVRADITAKEARIAALTAGIDDVTREYEAIATLQKEMKAKGKPLATTQKQKIEQFDHTVRGFKAEIESLQAAVKKGKQRVNGALQA